MSNKGAKETLKTLYGCRCMLTGVKAKRLQYHHIYKKEYGGRATVENGANVINEIHRFTHEQERIDKELFYLINDCLLCYKECIDRGLTELVEEYECEVMPEYRRVLARRNDKR
jgi:hypothetical protein